jgi:hypothetical protein
VHERQHVCLGLVHELAELREGWDVLHNAITYTNLDESPGYDLSPTFQPEMSGRMALAPEMQVLMATVRGDIPRLGAAFDEGVNWDRLSQLVVREHATIALYHCVAALLEQSNSLQVHPSVLADLQAGALRHELRLVAQDRAFAGLLSVFQEAGISVILLKGLALQKAHYASSLHRPAGDMDLLVPAADALRAWHLAQDIGWRADDTVPSNRYEKHHHLPPLVDGIGLRLEIHTDLLPAPNPFAMTVDEVRDSARPLSDWPSAAVPSPEMLLLHASIHFAWSNMLKTGSWKAFRDVDVLLEGERIDWECFLGLAGDSCRRHAAFWTLHLAKTWADVPVPDQVLAALAPPLHPLVRKLLENHFAASAIPTLGAPGPGQSVWLNRKLWELAMVPKYARSGYARPWEITSFPKKQPPGLVTYRGRQTMRRAFRESIYVMRLLARR